MQSFRLPSVVLLSQAPTHPTSKTFTICKVCHLTCKRHRLSWVSSVFVRRQTSLIQKLCNLHKYFRNILRCICRKFRKMLHFAVKNLNVCFMQILNWIKKIKCILPENGVSKLSEFISLYCLHLDFSIWILHNKPWQHFWKHVFSISNFMSSNSFPYL